jgi:hypothetical protein
MKTDKLKEILRFYLVFENISPKRREIIIDSIIDDIEYESIADNLDYVTMHDLKVADGVINEYLLDE